MCKEGRNKANKSIVESKKDPRIDINQMRGMLLSLGLCVSLLLVIVAFEWRSYDTSLRGLGNLEDIFEEQIDVPLTIQPPPPPPPKIIPKFIEIPDEEEIEEEEIELDVEITEDLVIEEIEYEAPVEEETDEIFSVVEEMASPIGGTKALYEYVYNNIDYPRQAKRMGIEGKVYVSFVVERDGSITNVSVVKGIGGGCDDSALRVMKACPIRWKPGKQRGKPVRTRHSLPIFFKLQ